MNPTLMNRLKAANEFAMSPATPSGPYTRVYAADEPARGAVEALPGPTVIEFGSPGCGWCRAAQPAIAAAFAPHSGLRHLKIADASGRALGRSFHIKLWPTLVFLLDGQETARLVRPGGAPEISAVVDRLMVRT